MTTDLVSVIIPAYNAALYLPSAVDSVLAQTYPNLEIHIVDDGSTDETRDVMQRYANDERVHCHHKTNGGVSAARNAGLRFARGSIIGLCDADDMWVPGKLELQLPYFSNPEVGVVYTDAQHMDERGELLPARAWGADFRASGRITNDLFVRNVVTGSTSLIRKSCLDRVGLYDESMTSAEDYELWLRLSTISDFVYVDEITYFYRQWSEQISGNSVEMLDNIQSMLRTFQDRHGSLLRPGVAQTAWARLMTDRALALAGAGRRREAFASIAGALRLDPFHVRAWKSAVRITISRD